MVDICFVRILVCASFAVEIGVVARRESVGGLVVLDGKSIYVLGSIRIEL